MKFNIRMKSEDVGIVDNDIFQFTWKQHFLTHAAMKKFTSMNGKIYTVNKSSCRVSYAALNRNEPGAVAARGWTQYIEKDFSHPIENDYLDAINTLIDSESRPLSPIENTRIIKYLALWSSRFSFKDSDISTDIDDQYETIDLTPFARQCLEQRNTSQAGVVLRHEQNSFEIEKLYQSIVNDLSNTKFQLHKVRCDMNLVIPDKTNLLCVPIASNSVLLPEISSFNGRSKEDVSKLNFDLINQSHEYYWFADVNKVIRC
ncbi:hypothetical protein CGT98_16925 [Vibrio metoecus]|uniref:Uncharacterized protein n=2 Tax=Vibrio metoecus TaxID=1481663 RepID=A0A271VJ36_VIBMT|nr:hypothetical protein [Vibrio metoecus]PAR17957.1 hypothetical protein CGU03_18070 [Vibrio metoecus]PAR34508.1 hypothetical protein CGT97_15925 [Vibrio metoecus]PAR37349.1 hypothetical protein CGT98_16925 [Vibrio metoecus]PAR40226.1 hypothetical protein CGT96_17965 [Vibrio metoecus]PAR52145.1 hypothetical protein CGT93_18410 [Vibrio metoecus]